MYQVYQNDKPADKMNYPEVDKSWDNSVFEEFDDAVAYTLYWAYPFGLEECKQMVKHYKMEINVPKDMSMTEFPVMMCIKKI